MKKALLFKKVFKQGRYYKTEGFSLRVLENGLDISRLGISVQSSIFPNATQRNRIKRLIREVFRKNKHMIGKGLDLIISPREFELNLINYDNIEKRILELCRKICKE